MSEIKLSILQIGEENWADKETIPETMEWLFIKPDQIEDFIIEEKNQIKLAKKLKKRHRKISALLLTEESYGEELDGMSAFFEVYEIFYPQQYTATESTADFLKKKMAQSYDMDNRSLLIHQFFKGLFVGQYGDKLAISQMMVSDDFEGNISYKGNSYLVLEGDFGEEYNFLLNFAYNSPFNPDLYNEIFFETINSDKVDLKLQISLIQDGSLDYILENWYFEGEELKQPIFLDADQKGTLSFKLFAKGSGKVELGPLHWRQGRNGLGEFILGGQRHADANGQEFMSYFDPADFKPPLAVYFSGFRTAEGFEGFWMMKGMQTPFMLICDPRLEGGSFYIGSKEYEEKIVSVIQEKLDFLGFTSDQLILSGLSMGTFGATFHGSKLNPHAIIIGKPIFSLGNVAQRERLERPNGFPTVLDIQKQNYDSLSQEGSDQLNQHFWKEMDEATFSNTTFALAYMKEDDYDGTAFPDLLQYFKDKHHKILGRGWSGRHGDGGSDVAAWFLSQYRRILKNDFGRGGD